MNLKNVTLTIGMMLLSACGMSHPRSFDANTTPPVSGNVDQLHSVQSLPQDAWNAPEYLPSETYTTPNETPGILVKTNMNLYNDDFVAHDPHVQQTFLENTSSGIVIESKNSTLETLALPVLAGNITRYTAFVWTGIGDNGSPNLSLLGSFLPNQQIQLPPGINKIVIFFGDDQTSYGLDYTVGTHFMFLSRISMQTDSPVEAIDNLEITNLP